MRSTWARCLWVHRPRTSPWCSILARRTCGCPAWSAPTTLSRPRASGRPSTTPARAAPSRTAPTPATAATSSSPTAPASVRAHLNRSWLRAMPPPRYSALASYHQVLVLCSPLPRPRSMLARALAVFGNLINDTCLWGGLTIAPQTFGIASSEPGQGECYKAALSIGKAPCSCPAVHACYIPLSHSLLLKFDLLPWTRLQPSTTATSTASWAWPSPSSPCPSAACCPGPSTTSWRRVAGHTMLRAADCSGGWCSVERTINHLPSANQRHTALCHLFPFFNTALHTPHCPRVSSHHDYHPCRAACCPRTPSLSTSLPTSARRPPWSWAAPTPTTTRATSPPCPSTRCR